MSGPVGCAPPSVQHIELLLAPPMMRRRTHRDDALAALLHKLMAGVDVPESASDAQKRVRALDDLCGLICQWCKLEGLDNDCAVKLFPFGSYRLGVHTPESDIDCLLLGPSSLARPHFFTSFFELLTAHDSVSEVTAIPDAYVPVIKCVFDGIEMDLVYARLSQPSIADDFNILDFIDFSLLEPKSVISLNGCRVTELLLCYVPNPLSFRALLRAVRLWAKRRGVYSNVLGYFGGVSWAILVTIVCQMNPQATLPQLMQAFFRFCAHWEWRRPIMVLQASFFAPPQVSHESLVTILTPAPPAMNSAYNVSSCTLRVLQREFKRASQLCEMIAGPTSAGQCWASLFEKSDFFFAHAEYLCVCVHAATRQKQRRWLGWVESKLRQMALLLPPQVKCRPFPHPFSCAAPQRPHAQSLFIGLDGQGYGVAIGKAIENFKCLVKGYPKWDASMGIHIEVISCVKLPDYVLTWSNGDNPRRRNASVSEPSRRQRYIPLKQPLPPTPSMPGSWAARAASPPSSSPSISCRSRLSRTSASSVSSVSSSASSTSSLSLHAAQRKLSSTASAWSHCSRPMTPSSTRSSPYLSPCASICSSPPLVPLTHSRSSSYHSFPSHESSPIWSSPPTPSTPTVSMLPRAVVPVIPIVEPATHPPPPSLTTSLPSSPPPPPTLPSSSPSTPPLPSSSRLSFVSLASSVSLATSSVVARPTSIAVLVASNNAAQQSSIDVQPRQARTSQPDAGQRADALPIVADETVVGQSQSGLHNEEVGLSDLTSEEEATKHVVAAEPCTGGTTPATGLLDEAQEAPLNAAASDREETATPTPAIVASEGLTGRPQPEQANMVTRDQGEAQERCEGSVQTHRTPQNSAHDVDKQDNQPLQRGVSPNGKTCKARGKVRRRRPKRKQVRHPSPDRTFKWPDAKALRLKRRQLHQRSQALGVGRNIGHMLAWEPLLSHAAVQKHKCHIRKTWNTWSALSRSVTLGAVLAYVFSSM